MSSFGLIGYPLEHSFSKKFFDEKFKREGLSQYTYTLFPVSTHQHLMSLLAGSALAGLNVTIPYKEVVTAYLDELDETAKAIGAVNCIKWIDGNLKGYNTDAPAFEQSLKSFLTTPPEQAFVLGSGGSSKAVCYVLKKMGIPYLVVSRKAGADRIAYEEIPHHMKAVNLFINTTPLGMFPNINESPTIPYHQLTRKDYLFDLVYNPEETQFLKRGKEAGAKTQNGLEMLQLQAEKSWEIWNR